MSDLEPVPILSDRSHAIVTQLVHRLTSRRIHAAAERALQDAIDAALLAMSVPFHREYHLSREDRVDFLVNFGLALEVKVDGGLSEVTRQLHRYAQHVVVDEIVLVTTRMRHRALPRELNGKAVHVAHLIGASL